LLHAAYFENLYATYQKVANFLIVYITDAHASDEWPVGKNVSFCEQPKSLDQRCLLAQKYARDHQLTVPMAVDTMENHFDQVFAAWPVRFYVVKDGLLEFKAQPNPDFYGYDFTQLADWLKNC